MSGNDERIKIIPKCPICGRRPRYWAISHSGAPVLWLYSKEYIIIAEKNNWDAKDFRGEGFHDILRSGDDFMRAYCARGCGKKLWRDEVPDLFVTFDMLFDSLFPNDILNLSE